MRLRFEGMSLKQEATLRLDYQRMLSMEDRTRGQGVPYTTWFGGDERPRLLDNLAKMRQVIRDHERTLSFVNRVGGVLKVEYKSLHSAELMPVGSAGNPLVETLIDGRKQGAIAYVFPVNRMNEVPGARIAKDLDPLPTSSHVGSGMRMYLTDLYFASSDKERASTIYHEITHKVLACEDICYGSTDCRALATSTRRALRNADSYAMFLLSCNP